MVAAGVVADGRTKIYASARGVGVEALFFAELVRACGRAFVLFLRAVCLLPPVSLPTLPLPYTQRHTKRAFCSLAIAKKLDGNRQYNISVFA